MGWRPPIGSFWRGHCDDDWTAHGRDVSVTEEGWMMDGWLEGEVEEEATWVNYWDI